MKIGIDCRTILNPEKGERAGIGHYTYYLVKHLLEIDRENQYVLFFDNQFLGYKEFEKENTKIVIFPFYQYKKYLPFAYSHILISAILEREKLDLYHNPSGIIPLRYKGKSIISVHDLALYLHPEWFPRPLFSDLFYSKILIPSSIKRAEKIIVPSQNTKKDLLDLFNISEDKIEVIYLAAEKKEITDLELKKILKDFKIAKDYILYLGTIEPRKNIIGVIKAFEAVAGNFKNLELVLAGGRGWKFQKVFSAIKKSKFKERIKYLGYVSRKQKIALLKKAICFIWPTFYEGFGLPALEAMGLGTPVITSNLSSLPEVCGKVAILVNPQSQGEITESLRKILIDKNLQKDLSQKGIIQAQKFSWQKTAFQTLEVYQSLLEK